MCSPRREAAGLGEDEKTCHPEDGQSALGMTGSRKETSYFSIVSLSPDAATLMLAP
jgi:hypothetical protein